MLDRVVCRIILGPWSELQEHAQRIRYEVFVQEQSVPEEIELDDMDALCLHAVAYDQEGIPTATGRLLPDGHIGRMAVRKYARGSGVGSDVLRSLMEAARQRGQHEVVLNAQIHAENFYLRQGFIREGDVFWEVGIPHIHMRANVAT